MSNIGSWHLAAASNNATPPDGWPEGQAPSTVNNCAREMMAAIRAQWDDAAWFNFYPTTSPSSYIQLKAQNKIRILNQSAATTYTATDIYPIGTRLKVLNNNTFKYGSVISLSSSSTAVLLTMSMDSGTLTSTITMVERSIITPLNSPVPSTTTAPTIVNGYRLTLTSGTPVTISDVTGATTLYLTPYEGADIAIYSGSAWVVFRPGELSITTGGLASSTMYDVFIQYNSGVPQLSLTAWTNVTTRATALAYQNGVLVLSGTPTSRYVGSIYSNASTQFTDSGILRGVWNYYNRVNRRVINVSMSASWTYASATIRQCDASALFQFDFVIGVSEDNMQFIATLPYNMVTTTSYRIGWGLDSTTAFHSMATYGDLSAAGTVSLWTNGTAILFSHIPIGYHYVSLNEQNPGAAGTATMNFDSAYIYGNIRG